MQKARLHEKFQAANNSKCHHRSAETSSSSSNKKKTICCWNAGACGRSVPRTTWYLAQSPEKQTNEPRKKHERRQWNRIRAPQTIYAVLNKWTTMLNMIRVNCMACACFDDFVLQIDFFPLSLYLPLNAQHSSTKSYMYSSASVFFCVPIQQFPFSVRFSINFFASYPALRFSPFENHDDYICLSRYYCKIISANGQWRRYR